MRLTTTFGVWGDIMAWTVVAAFIFGSYIIWPIMWETLWVRYSLWIVLIVGYMLWKKVTA